jgi:F-box/leucine-rich repeat protein 14
VEPQTRDGHANWADVLNEVAQEGIPGIATGPNVDDQTLAEIGKLNHLTYLDLSLAKDITDVGLQHLRGLDQLQAIYLSRCKQITDKGLQVLTSFPMLKVVRLTNLPLITDEGLSSLSDHENLQLVTMTLFNTGDDALQVLRNKPSLTHLSPGNKTTDEGLALLKSFPGLANWSDGRPKHLIDEYRSPSPSCLNLDLREGMPITNDGLKQLEDLDGVYEMGIPVQHVESKISGAGAEHIAKMRNVQVLWWASEVCDDESLTHLGNMINLESLVCFGSSATDRGYEALSKCESLTSVYASGKISSRTLESLSKLPSLRYLNVDGKHMKDGDLEPLSRFPALNNLWAWRFGNEGYLYIGRVEGLEELVNMYCNDTDDAATEYLAGLSNLHKYNIWTTQITDKSLDVLSGMDSLQQILLQKCNRLTDEGLAKLQRLPLLRSLSLQQCQGLTEKGIGVFGVDVQVNFQPA